MRAKQEVIDELFKKGVLVSKELLEQEENLDGELFEKLNTEQDLLVLNKDYADIITKQASLVDWYELDSHRVDIEKDRNDELYQSELQKSKTLSLSISAPNLEQKQELTNLESQLEEEFEEQDAPQTPYETQKEPIPQQVRKINIVLSFENKPKKYTIGDFAAIFRSRFNILSKILRQRTELASPVSIGRINSRKEREQVTIIGLVTEIGETKNGNLMLTLEDPTGSIKVFVPKNEKDLFSAAKELVPDEVIGVTGQGGDGIVFSNNIVWPDLPTARRMKKGPVDENVIFLSDVHVGSTFFLEKEFEKFLKWVKGESGSPAQRELANKSKYIIIAGDVVDGIGIYPGQEKELTHTDIRDQYKVFIDYIKQIPQDKEIVICPGNHDMVHLAEPQPVFYQEYASELFELPNVQLVTNPAVVNIGKTKDFEGFDVLLYHGYSFDYYVANVDSIRTNGGYHRADLIMKFLLKRRHLAPTFRSTPYFPGHKEDPLIIKQIPDFFISGHIHYSSVANYKGVTMICGSCWQGKTDFQEKLGHEPEPGRVPVVNLKSREVKVLKFI